MQNSYKHQPEILIITGYSGAGKSSVLRALEDSGFFCVDNLPVPLLDSFYQLIAQSKINGHRIALGIDIRGGESMDTLLSALDACKKTFQGCVKILFLTSSSRVILRRFQETRRKHPLADNIEIDLAIVKERELLCPVIDMADIVLDTDQLNVHQLRMFIKDSVARSTTQKMIVHLVSFGFKYGVPDESNFVYDVRSLPIP